MIKFVEIILFVNLYLGIIVMKFYFFLNYKLINYLGCCIDCIV